MSEFEVRRARMEVERSTVAFEDALDALVEQIQMSVDKLSDIADSTKNITTKVREMVDVDQIGSSLDDFVNSSIDGIKDSATRLISEIGVSAEDELRNLRQIAEEELETFDMHPLMTWGAVLASGLALGFILAKKTGDKFIST